MLNSVADDESGEQYSTRDDNFAQIFYQKFYFWRITRKRISFLRRRILIIVRSPQSAAGSPAQVTTLCTNVERRNAHRCKVIAIQIS